MNRWGLALSALVGAKTSQDGIQVLVLLHRQLQRSGGLVRMLLTGLGLRARCVYGVFLVGS